MTEYSKFKSVVGYSVSGIILGIILGILFGLLIYIAQESLIWINGQIFKGSTEIYGFGQSKLWPDPIIPEGLGMCFGALIGSILGGVYGLRVPEKKQKTIK